RAGPPDRRAPVLEGGERVPVGAAAAPPAGAQVARPDQEERRPPGAASVDPVAGRAEPEVESLHGGRAGSRARRVEEPCEPTGEEPDRREYDEKYRKRAAHGGEDSTATPGRIRHHLTTSS